MTTIHHFTSDEIKVYMEEKGIKRSQITPLQLQANSEAENFMKPVTKVIWAAHAEGRDWRKDLYQFLLNYRATPHSTTGFAPSELLFNRKIKTRSLWREIDIDRTVQKNNKRAKERMKKHAVKRSRAGVLIWTRCWTIPWTYFCMCMFYYLSVLISEEGRGAMFLPLWLCNIG